MVEEFVQRILEDARQKAAAMLEAAQEEAAREIAAEQQALTRAYEQRAEELRRSIARQKEIDIAAVRLEKSREILAARNEAIAEVLQEIEQEFTAWIDREGRAVAEAVIQSLSEPVTLRIPPDCSWSVTGNEAPGVTTLRDPSVKNGFIVETGRVTIPVTWEQIHRSMGPALIEAAARELFNPVSE